MLEAKKITKGYEQAQDHIDVLADLELNVNKGESVAIVGESGSGKSTLMSLLAGLDRVDHGEILVAGTSLNNLDEKGLSQFRAKHIAIVFQQFHLMPQLTALENVSLPLEIANFSEPASRARSALDKVGLLKREKHFPHQLSGGEIQRVAIARAMVMEPDLLLADEPSGNLDAKTGRRVMDLLFELVSQSQMTTLLVTHNEELADRCQRKLSLSEGKLWERS